MTCLVLGFLMVLGAGVAWWSDDKYVNIGGCMYLLGFAMMVFGVATL